MAAPSLAPSSSPVSRLYRHALESIFAALTLREINCSAQVSKDWLAIVQRMPSVCASVTLRSADGCRSFLSRHVSHYKGLGEASASDLTLLTDRFPRLSSLCWSLASRSCEWPDAAPFTLPPRLQSLSMELPFHPEGATGLWLLYDAVAPLSQLHTLRLQISNAPRQMRVDALSKLPALTSLSLLILFEVIPIEVVSDLRLCLSLRSLSLDGIDSKALPVLFAEPHSFHGLQHLELLRPCKVDDTSAAPLLSLAELTSLSLVVGTQRPEFIAHWSPTLRSLSLEVDSSDQPTVAWSSLMRCSDLTRLSLNGARLTGTDLASVLAALPHLQWLSLSWLVSLEADWWSRCFSHGPSIAPSLTHLCFRTRSHIAASALLPLRDVESLRFVELELRGSRDAQLDADLAAYAGPSPRLPQLTRFSVKYIS